MAQYHIEYEQLKSYSNEFTRLKFRISELTSSLINVTIKIDKRDDQMKTIANEITKCSNKLINSQTKLHEYSRKIIEINNIYLNAEHSIYNSFDTTGVKTGIIRPNSFVSNEITISDRNSVSSMFSKIMSYIEIDSIPLLSYPISLLNFFTGKNTGLDQYKDLVGLSKSSAKMYEAIYNCFEKSLNIYSAGGLSRSFGHGTSIVSMIGKAIEFSEDSTNTYETIYKYQRGESSIWDVYSDITKTIGSSVGFGGSAYLFANFTPKTVQLVLGKGGSLKSGLVASTKLTKVCAYITLAETVFATVSKGIKSYGVYSADGEIDTQDVSYIMIESSCSGLNALTGDFLSEEALTKVTDGLKDYASSISSEASEIINSNKRLNNYYQNANSVEQFFIINGAINKAANEKISNFIGNAVSTAGKFINNSWSNFLVNATN